MLLRDHPLMMFHSARSWPPVWSWSDGTETTHQRGEVGILKDVKPSYMRIPLKSPPIPKQTGTHSGANRQSEKSERSDAGILFIA
jgi:hypothetical protein